jgi:hypothetical protein
LIFPRPRRNLQLIEVGLVGITAGLAVLALCNYASVAASSTTTLVKAYPTSIPWLPDRATCENTDRSWHDEQCWDDQHDPYF